MRVDLRLQRHDPRIPQADLLAVDLLVLAHDHKQRYQQDQKDQAEEQVRLALCLDHAVVQLHDRVDPAVILEITGHIGASRDRPVGRVFPV